MMRKISIADQDGIVCIIESPYLHVFLTAVRSITGVCYSDNDGLINTIGIRKQGSVQLEKYTISVIEDHAKNTALKTLAYFLLFIAGVLAGMAIAAVIS